MHANLHILATGPLLGDAVRVFAVVIVATAWAGVGAALLPHHIQTLPPLVILLVTGVVSSGLLGEVSEHGGQGLATHCITRLLSTNIGADGGELGYSLEKSSVGVAGMMSRKQVFIVLLG